MKRSLTIIVLILITFLLLCAYSFLTDKSNFGEWILKSKTPNNNTISWSSFNWVGDTLGTKYFDKAAIMLPAKLDDFTIHFKFQLDLGASTVLYEKNVRSLISHLPEMKSKIAGLKSPLQFWNSQIAFKDVSLHFGDNVVHTDNCRIERDYGQALSFKNSTDSSIYELGTIGADLFKDKVLIIDYPNKKWAVCQTLASEYNVNLIDIELDPEGRVILPMKYKGKHYRIMFDSGSSIFPLITLDKNMPKFSGGPDIDTLAISSWGQIHNVTGKMIADSFELAGHVFSNVKVYANHSGLGIDPNTDGMTGNALFWDKTIIIDFKNRKFGIK